MTTIHLIKILALAAVLGGSAPALTAQNATAECPFGQVPGSGRLMTPEQRAVHRAAAQQLLLELRQKQADGTLTAEEQAWLQQVRQRGGRGIIGTPRGAGSGEGQGLRSGQGPRDGQGLREGRGQGRGQGFRDGQGHRQGQGQGLKQGPRDGTGPGSVDGTCPAGARPRGGGRR
jgi:hypothetical protein